jgi:hypothetical protein
MTATTNRRLTWLWVRRRVIIGTSVALLTGALAWVLPPHVLGQIVKHYPETTWQWLGDGVWNFQPAASIPICVLIGFIYGLLVPKYWFLSFLATWWVFPLNFLLDVAQFPTSHNLWPFELFMFAIFNVPTLGAAWLGKRLSRWHRPQQRGVM